MGYFRRGRRTSAGIEGKRGPFWGLVGLEGLEGRRDLGGTRKVVGLKRVG